MKRLLASLLLGLLACSHSPGREPPTGPLSAAGETRPVAAPTPLGPVIDDHLGDRGVSPLIGSAGRNAEPPVCDEPTLRDEEASFECGAIARHAIYQQLLDAAMAEVLLTPTRSTPAPRATDWNRAITPSIRAIGDELGVSGREWAAISRHGFAVLDRSRYGSHYEAYKDIYRSELPLMVTADSILHAVFRSYEAIVRDLEAPLLARVEESLGRTHRALPSVARSLPDDAVRDVDLYLSVARSLAAGEAVAPLDPSLRGSAQSLASAVEAAGAMAEVSLFGRVRLVDFSIYAPRGPYAEDARRRRWFRVAQWLSRAEFNVVSRGCRSSQPGIVPVLDETPREALDAFALALLMESSGTAERFEEISALWGMLAGRREDAGIADLNAMRVASGVVSLRAPDAFERLKAAVGEGFARTARTHPMPQGVRALPVIATALGARVVADAQMTRSLVHDEVPGRYSLGAADLAYALGHDGAARYLTVDPATSAELRTAFARSRSTLDARDDDEDLYASWLSAVRRLNAPLDVGVPSYMRTRAFDDLRINSLIVGYGQVRHANAVLAAESYDGAACRIPDAWVEPAPEVYRRLRRFVERAFRALSGSDVERWAAWARGVDRVLRVLERVSLDELAGHALTQAQRHALGYVAEVLPSSEGAPTHTGWYLEMFPSLDDTLAPADFVADWYASVNDGSVSYVGASGVALGLFVVDRGGAPRLMVGPVTLGYEHHGALAHRLNDADARALSAADRAAPWARSYLVEGAPAPRISLDSSDLPEAASRQIAARYRVGTETSPGMLVVEFLSAHRRVIARGRGRVGASNADLVVRWLQPSTLDREHREQEVCAARVSLGPWLRTVRTDQYPYSEGCQTPSPVDLSTQAAPEPAASAED